MDFFDRSKLKTFVELIKYLAHHQIRNPNPVCAVSVFVLSMTCQPF